MSHLVDVAGAVSVVGDSHLIAITATPEIECHCFVSP